MMPKVTNSAVDVDGVVCSVGFFSRAYTPTHPAPLVAVDCSSSDVDDYAWNKDRTALVKVGSHNLDDRIQAAGKGLTIYEILERAAKGDVDAIAQFQPGAVVDDASEVVDYSDMPETMADASDIARAAPVVEAALKKAADDAVAKAKAAEAPKVEPVPDVKK